ncbi:RING finger protein nhl-1 [Chionoecetes opilio]|uniref:RING finger protein nhl-1 n=1 Tax=Chionoecetes opilio TaxID=41210 RepID=A0A8J4YMX9_CHIOP|nr:RING finger protein nhl-1 [Chionoecetes opilio]
MTPGTVEKLWASLVHGLMGGCSVRMSGVATATGGREPRPRHAPRRAASSVSRLPRDAPVVVTSYLKVGADLPPLPRPSHLPRTRSAPRCDAPRMRELRREGSATPSTSGVSSASSSPASRKPRPRGSSEGLATSSGASSPSRSPDTRAVVEDEVTCAICLDLMHRPRRLPCGHTFCLLCLQNYANTCSLHRGDLVQGCASHFLSAGVPGGPPSTWCFLCLLQDVVELPDVPRRRPGARGGPGGAALQHPAQARRNLLRRRRETDPSCLTCTACGTMEGAATCGHCQEAWCEACGATHLRQVQTDIVELRGRLASARDTLDCRAEEEEARLTKLEETIVEAVEERVTQLLEEGTNLTAQVQEMRAARQQRALTFSQELEQALIHHTPDPTQLV